MQAIVNLPKTDLLKRASKHFFSLGVDDGAANLCRVNSAYGLAKLHVAQEELGLESNATFISTPDQTISRNQARWKAGYGYGGKLTWGRKNDPLIFVDIKPNACGMLVGGLDELPQPDEIIRNINKVVGKDIYLDNMKLQWDFKKGNHFIDVFKTGRFLSSTRKLPPYMFIIHGSVPELRSETEKGPGLYYDVSKTLEEKTHKINTPFGIVQYLDGNDAREYLEFFMYAKKFAAIKREKAAKLLFGNFIKISNPMHQGLLNYGEIVLGAQHINEDTRKLFPIALRSDLPAFLATPKRNLSAEIIEELGFETRAKKWGVYKVLRSFNALPHGGGYSLPHISRVREVKEIDQERFFVCEQENEEAITILSDVKETQFTYRGKRVVKKLEELELGTIETKLYPRFVLKV